MTIKEVINQLEDLINDREAFILYDEEYDDEILIKDIEALRYAIDVLKENI